MSAQHHFAPSDQWDRDLYARERVLNSAIIAAGISKGWEEYLEVLDAFYADDVELTPPRKLARHVAKSAFGRYSTSLQRFM
jgi:hypothetical protein